MRKIYQFMTEQGLKKEFFSVVFQKLVLMLIMIATAIFTNLSPAAVITFFVFSTYHNFHANKSLYELKSKYKHCGLSPKAASDAYSAALCFIREENAVFRYSWFAAAAMLVISLALNQAAIVVFAACTHVALIVWEHHVSEYYNEST